MYHENPINNQNAVATWDLTSTFCSSLKLLATKSWIRNKLKWRWKNGCWNLVGTP
jgi:hypothetical protein